MQQNIEFERCIDFLVRMIDKYGDEVLRELEKEKHDGFPQAWYIILPVIYLFRENDGMVSEPHCP